MVATALLPGSVPAAESYWYLGANVGQSRIDATAAEIEKAFLVDDGFIATGTTLDKSDTGWRAYVGYRFNRLFALEAGYADLGEATFDTTIVGAPFPINLLTLFPIRATASAEGVVVSGVLYCP